MNTEVLSAHKRTKLHKKRVKLLHEVPYTQEEAEAAAGLGAGTAFANKVRAKAEHIAQKMAQIKSEQ